MQAEAWAYISELKRKDHNRVLTYRYIECLNWDDIADLMGCTIRHAHRLEVEATAGL